MSLGNVITEQAPEAENYLSTKNNPSIGRSDLWRDLRCAQWHIRVNAGLFLASPTLVVLDVLILTLLLGLIELDLA